MKIIWGFPMSATISRRALSFVPVIASVVFFAGCSPSSLDLGEVTPPDLQADPAVTTVFRFEADEMPAVVNGSFTIGNDPLTATFTGGSVVEPTDSGLARSQTQSWLIPEGESGTITLNTPAIGMALYFRNEFNPPEEVRAVPTRGGVECPAPVDFGNNAGEAFGDVLYARGSFNDWAGASSDPATDFVNLGGGIYQARFPMEAGSYNFKLANEGWTLEYA
ncbi:MAG: hypothetical protein OEQ74_08165, partial [Gammaproteobacteria bacterium]|nr:hypothetical protein [Gammaproteobacteria bacterium]